MKVVQGVLDCEYALATVDPRIFGSFVEMLGRCVYSGIYEPGHPEADAQGMRQDVLALVRELRPPVIRFPGGNFVSNYRWEDGVGPASQRPKRLDMAWATTETNEFGTGEFMDWCQKAGTKPMMAVNLGTRGPAEAAALMEYCNHEGGTYWSDLRKSHGASRPYGVKLWCLGNEMDGPWQMGAKTAYEYGRVAREAGKLMKWIDPSAELVVCGSSNRAMPTFGRWEAQVLEESYDVADYISLHTYYGNSDHDTDNFLARSLDMDRFIQEVVATCDYVKAIKRSDKRINLSFDEWNVWFHSNEESNRLMEKSARWGSQLPLLEDVYTMEDALLVGEMLITLMNHADRVKIACQAQLVNVIGLIMTQRGGPAWRQSIFYPFAQASALAQGGTVYQARLDAPLHDTKDFTDVPMVELAAVKPADGGLALFVVNRSLDKSALLNLQLRGFEEMTVHHQSVMRHDDLNAVNTAGRPCRVSPVPANTAQLRDGQLKAKLPPASWNVIVLADAKA